MPHSTSSKSTESSSTFVPLTGSDVFVYPTYMNKETQMKLPKVVELVKAETPRHGCIAYGSVESESRSRLRHIVVKVGRKWRCDCEHNLFRSLVCDHIRAARRKWSQLRAA